MKVIGMVGNKEYLVQISHTELEKVFNKYYGKLEELKVGDTTDLGEGYNFASEIKSSCEKMADAMKSFESKRAVMLRFAEMVMALSEEDKGGAV